MAGSRHLFALFLLLVSGISNAATWSACTGGQVPYYTVRAVQSINGSYACSTTEAGHFSDPNAAAASCINGPAYTNGGNFYQPTSNWRWQGTAPTTTDAVDIEYDSANTAPFWMANVAAVRQYCETPPPNPCEQLTGGAEKIWSAIGDTASCVDGCKVTVTGPGNVGLCMGSPSQCASEAAKAANFGTYTGEQCDAGDTADEALPTDEKCQTVNGHEVCQNVNDQNCISIDGQQSCYSSAGEACTTPECTASAEAMPYPDGSEVANDDAPTPPAPDNGTSGEKAPPDLEFGVTPVDPATGQAGPQNPLHYFSPTTAGNSTTNGAGDADGDGVQDSADSCPGTPTDTTVDGNGCPSDEGEGECVDNPETPANECGSGAGDGSVKGPGGTAKSYGESLTEFRSRVAASGLITSLGSIGDSMPLGSCPSLSFNAPILGTIGTTIHCDLAASYLPLLSAIFLAGWALLAVRIFMSA